MANPILWERRSYAVTNPNQIEFTISVKGRVHWALERLLKAGNKGCTPIDNPASRWSAYVFDLRQLGVEIETIHEPHAGAFAGTHARYVMRSKIFLLPGKGKVA